MPPTKRRQSNPTLFFLVSAGAISIIILSIYTVGPANIPALGDPRLDVRDLIQYNSAQVAPEINLDTPHPTWSEKYNITAVLNDTFTVYINDTFIDYVDPNRTKGIYNSSMSAVLRAFDIWEESTGGNVSFSVVDDEKADITVSWFPGEATPYGGGVVGEGYWWGYECDGFWFVTGGEIRLHPQKEEVDNLAIAMHEIGHVLDLDHLGNRDNIMSALHDSSSVATQSEAALIRGITDDIKRTIGMKARPEYIQYCG
jgi:hypothetical protein